MKAFATIFIFALLASALASANPLPAVQVVSCVEDPIGIWNYEFYICAGDFSADEMRIVLDPGEVGEPTVIMSCWWPVGFPGTDCEVIGGEAVYTFPEIGAFECIPGEAGAYLGIAIQTDDGFTQADVEFYLGGEWQWTFPTSINCPPTAADDSDWGSIKSLYR
jgi:hypothetical protein